MDSYEVCTESKLLVVPGFRHIFRKLILGSAPATTKNVGGVSSSQVRERARHETQGGRKCRKRLGRILCLSDTREISAGYQKLAPARRTKRVCLDELALPPRHIVIRVEQRTDGIGNEYAMSVIVLYSEKGTVGFAYVPVHSPSRERISTWAPTRRDKMQSAGHSLAQPRKQGATGGVCRAEATGGGGTHSWRGVIEIKDLFIKRI